MKIVGLITEYNPFHNGHLYHIEESKKITGADAAVVVMSGDYVQRGTPAIMPKRLRTEMALKCGAAAVFELPVCYAAGSAEIPRFLPLIASSNGNVASPCARCCGSSGVPGSPRQPINNSNGIAKTRGSVNDSNGLIAFPRPEFCI